MNVGLRTVQSWLYDEKDPSERLFKRMVKVLDINPLWITSPTQDLRDLARSKRVMDFYAQELVDANPPANYSEVQQLESDIQRAGEMDAAEDDTREADVTVPC